MDYQQCNGPSSVATETEGGIWSRHRRVVEKTLRGRFSNYSGKFEAEGHYGTTIFTQLNTLKKTF